MYFLNDKEVIIEDIETLGVDSMIVSAYWVETGEHLTDKELDELTELYPDAAEELADSWFDVESLFKDND